MNPISKAASIHQLAQTRGITIDPKGKGVVFLMNLDGNNNDFKIAA